MTVYLAASSSSVGVALMFNKLVASNPRYAGGIMGRFVPFIAVAAANCVNIPLMRQQEIKQGIDIHTIDGQEAGKSKNAAIGLII